MAAVQVVSHQSAVERVTSLPLVSSTYGLVCSVYCTTRDHHPYLRSVCQAAEQGVRAITSVAMTTALPVIGKLQPQLAIANDLACKGLDQIEKTLPILHQPSDQIVTNAKDAVSSATGAVTVARATVSDTLSGAVNRTRAAVSGGANTALSTSENLMERYLPLSPEEMELEGGPTRGAEEPSYYVRLGTLSTRLRRRAYSRAVARVRDAKQRSQEAVSRLHHTVNLVEYARKNMDGVNRVYDTLSSLVQRKTSSSGQEENDDHKTTEAIESRSPALVRSLPQHLQTTCFTLASGLQGLPGHIQREALSLSRSACYVYDSVSKAAAAAVGDMPDSTLAGSRARLGQMKRSLDNVLDYLVNNTPLNWLVGPFYPRLAPPSPTTSPSTTAIAEPAPSQPTQAPSPPAQIPSIQAPSPPASRCLDHRSSSPVSHQEEVSEAEMLMESQQQLFLQ
ncbi:Perilipin-2 [Merluccius polli]|uniref:Perilipin n=1 Tax=Merluccius polli TaxID=89951 RepID=A0AA47P3I8_MERPO|nr:Perilipin-2 [Merluccius polli]